MWSCNGSASLAVSPERRVFLIVTLWAPADYPSGGDERARRPTLSRQGPPIYGLGSDRVRGARLAVAPVAAFGSPGVGDAEALPGRPRLARRVRTAPSTASVRGRAVRALCARNPERPAARRRNRS
jgi:hypothetical protein